MELKDVILSTLAEIDDIVEQKDNQEILQQKDTSNESILIESKIFDSEERFLQTMQERLLVLFEGFQAPNNSKIEAKVDLTLNFLEYLLSMIENRLLQIENNEKS